MEQRQSELQKKEQIETALKELDQLCDTLMKCKPTTIVKTTYLTNKPIRATYFGTAIMGVIVGICLKSISTIVVCSLLSLMSAVMFYKFNKEKTITKKTVSIETYNKKKRLNLFPDEVLGKIKRIENECVLLQGDGLDNELVSLFEQSVNLTIALVLNDEFDVNQEGAIEKISEYLDNTLEYIKTLKKNKQVESAFIKADITNSLMDELSKNNEILKSLIQDNHYLTDIYNKKNPNN